MKNDRRHIKTLFSRVREKSVKSPKKQMLFSELFSLLSSGLDFSQAFKLLISGERDEYMKSVLKKLFDEVVAGASLWKAMENAKVFSALDYGVIRIGEETGQLNKALEFLTDYYDKKVKQHRMVSSAITYPLIILCVAVIVVIFMLAVVVPMFEQVYSRMGGELPAITQMIIRASKNFPFYATATVTVILFASVLLYSFHENTAVRSRLASLLLAMPVVGKVIKKNYQAHFCKLLYLLISSGVPLLSGIELLKSIITFYPYQLSFDTMTAGLQRGELFSTNLEKYPKLYDKKLSMLLRIGEETNRLPEMLHKQSEDITKQLEYQLKQMGSLLEPAMIMFVGIIVAVILISMYLPMFKLGGVMG